MCCRVRQKGHQHQSEANYGPGHVCGHRICMHPAMSMRPCLKLRPSTDETYSKATHLHGQSPSIIIDVTALHTPARYVVLQYHEHLNPLHQTINRVASQPTRQCSLKIKPRGDPMSIVLVTVTSRPSLCATCTTHGHVWHMQDCM